MGVRVSKATARRATLATGTAARAVWEAEVERLKQEAPQAPDGADKQAMSGDGAFVHLVGGEWAEVKTLVIGEVTRNKRGEVVTQHLSTFSRLAEAERLDSGTSEGVVRVGTGLNLGAHPATTGEGSPPDTHMTAGRVQSHLKMTLIQSAPPAAIMRYISCA